MSAFKKLSRKYRITGLGMLLILAGWLLAAQGAVAGTVKIGFIDIQKAITETKEFKKSQKKFQADVQREKTLIEGRKKRLEDMIRDLNKQGFVLSPEEKRKKQENLLNEKKAFERYVQDREEEFARKEKKALEVISKKMLKVIKQLGKQKALTMVIEKKAVFYSDSALDLTNLATKTYDRLYP